MSNPDRRMRQMAPSSPRVARMNRSLVRTKGRMSKLLLLSFVAVAACDSPVPPDTDSDASDDRPVLTAAIVSNPVTSVADAPGAAGIALSRTATGGLVYVSLPPGSIPEAEQATISSPRSGGALTVTVVDGGFDPVAVEADAGDTLALDVRLTDADKPLRYAMVVPARVPPVVVRTDPPPKKRDVPLNATMLIVFSEPIDTATLTDSSVPLSRSGVPVAGILAFGDAAHLTLTFAPAEPLAAGGEYTLLVTPSVKDLDGEALEGPTSVAFTTAGGTIEVAATTTGPDPDADGYTVTMDGAPRGQLGRNGAITLSDVSPGSHEIRLDGVEPNCAVAGNDSRTVGVALGETTTVTFDVACAAVGRLVFGSLSDRQIYTITIDGAGRTLLTTEGRNERPVWSPNGRRIAFVRYDGGGRPDIYLMDADGGNVARRTTGSGFRSAAWSPDGRQLAVSTEGVYFSDIWVISADDQGSAPVHLAADARSPAWSPDGERIAYVHISGDDGYDAINVMNADGTGATPLTPPAGGRYGPTWSPDGSRIASSLCTAGVCDLIVMNADGSDARTLTDVGTASWGAAWSPDGRWIAVTLWPPSGPRLAYVPAEGGTPVIITGDGFAPSWRP